MQQADLDRRNEYHEAYIANGISPIYISPKYAAGDWREKLMTKTAQGVAGRLAEVLETMHRSTG
jgi:hypothetical protein